VPSTRRDKHGRSECAERLGQVRSQIGETHQPVEVHDILSERRHLGESALLAFFFFFNFQKQKIIFMCALLLLELEVVVTRGK